MPNRFTPINSRQSTQKAFQQINNNFMMLDAETYTKTFSGGGNTQAVNGKLPNGKFGNLIYDPGGMARGLFGQAPGNGRPGLWITKAGCDVLKEVK